MKPDVLFATQDRQSWHRLRDKVADLCELQMSASVGKAYSYLRERPFRVFILDTKLPQLNSVELLHALWHAPTVDGIFVSWGSLDKVLCVSGTKKWEPIVVRRSFFQLVETVRALLDPAASRTIDAVSYQPKEDAFFVTFRNGKAYELPRKSIEADDGSPFIGAPRIIHGGDAFEVRQESGNTYQVAWDFVLYHREPSYPYHKGKADQREAEARRAARIAARIRQEREARGWSLGELARRTGIQPPNLSRLESGKHAPSLETLERVADALGVRVADLIAG